MMRLSTLWRVDRTVAADGRSPVAERILEPWAHDPGSARFFRSSANFLYRFRHRDEARFLRFADSSERSRESIEAELDLVEWLAARGLDVAVPVRSRRGRAVETVETDRGTFHAVVFAALRGSQLEIDDIDTERLRAWGAALGRLHAATTDYPAPASARGSWRDLLDRARGVIAPDETAVRAELDAVESALAALPTERGTYGLIHFDFELDNLVWRDDAVGILDFDDCARLWYAADIDFALRDLGSARADLGDDRVREFLRGYAARHPLDPDLAARLPLCRRFGELVRHARLVRAVDLGDDPEHPNWLRGLIGRFHGWMDLYRASLGGRGEMCPGTDL